MKVALIVPNFRWSNNNPDFLWDYIPYNLCLLGAMLPKSVEVKVIDAYQENLSASAFKRIIAEMKPDIVGITVMIDQHLEAGIIAANRVKCVSRNIKVVMGGASVTANTEEVIKHEEVDMVIQGEGELSFTSYIDARGLPAKRIVEPYPIESLDLLPRPSYNLIPLDSYISKPPTRKSVDSPRAYPYARIITSRGCPYGCCFCQVESIMGKRWRGRSPKSVLEEIAWLKKDYGIKSLVFDDDNMLFDKDRAKEIFRGMISRGLAMPWSMIATSVIKIDPEMVELMKASGCQYVDIAIESGVERVLKEIIHKPVILTEALKTVKLLKEAGIFVAANFIIGFPGETWAEIRETLDFASKFGADYTKIFTATPLKHTKLWDTCVKGGYLKKGNAWAEGQIETEEFTTKDLTILRAYEWDRINFTSPYKRARIALMMGIGLGELEEIRKKSRRRVYEGD